MMNNRRLFEHVVGIVFVCAAAASALTAYHAFAASPLYYCPDRKADQQYSAQPDPGCVPLVSRTPDKNSELPSGVAPRHFHADNLSQDVSAFLTRYQKFLECCKTDLAELRELEDMAGELDQLLDSMQRNLSNYSLASRGIMLRDLIPRVAKVREDMKILRGRLEKIGELSRQRETLEHEESGLAAQKIRELEESIEQDIHAPTLPGSAKTGGSIGTAQAAGPAIGRSPKAGTDIGQEGVTGQDIGATPKSSRNIGGAGLSGFEIGATGRAGPDIGESTLNEETSSGVKSTLQRSTIGSSLSDSTVRSDINSSTVGSSMQDTSVGSSFGGSSVGSSLKAR